MKVVLTFVPALKDKRRFETLEAPPLALYVLSSVIKRDGHIVKVIDPCEYLIYNNSDNIEKNCVQHIKDHIDDDTDLIAFSSNTFNWGITKNVINRLKKILPDLMVATGGLHPSIFDKHVLEVCNVDFVLRGEGEKSFPHLLKVIIEKGNLKEVKGLTFREKEEIIRNEEDAPLEVSTLESLSVPDYELIPKTNPYTSLPIESSRGCAFSCAFCSIPHRHNWRGYSPQNVIDRIEHLYNSFGASCKEKLMLFVDDCFTINTKRALEIFRKLYSLHKTELRYFIEVRISDILKNNMLSQIPFDLVGGMQIGVECRYDEGLKKVHKEITISQLMDAMNLVKLYGYASKCFLSFIIGFPWETEKEINLTLDTVKKIAGMYHVPCNINWLIFLPSDLWKVRTEYGIKIDESIYDQPLWLNDHYVFKKAHPAISDETVKRVEKRIAEMGKNGLPVFYNSAPSLK